MPPFGETSESLSGNRAKFYFHRQIDARAAAEFAFRHFRTIFLLIFFLVVFIVFGIVDWGNGINDRVEFVQEQVVSYTSDFPIKGPSEAKHPRKIWQTAYNGSKTIDSELVANYLSWHRLNPRWQYELLNDENADRYIESRYMKQHKEVVDVFTEIQSNLARVNLFRYLVLLADGGLYSDVDTECLRPIDEWVPDEYKEETNVVVGVQYDRPGTNGTGPQIQLATWVIMSEKGHGIMKLMVERVIESIRDLTESQNARPRTLNITLDDVLASTGPDLFTQCVWDYLTEKTEKEFSAKDVSGLTQPKLVQDVLLLPPEAFRSGNTSLANNNRTNDGAVVHHQLRGLWEEWKDEDRRTKEEDREYLGRMLEFEDAAEEMTEDGAEYADEGLVGDVVENVVEGKTELHSRDVERVGADAVR